MSSILWWERSWNHDVGFTAYIAWSPHWRATGTYTVTGTIAVAGQVKVLGNISSQIPVPKNIVQVGAVPIAGAVKHYATFVYPVPFPIELRLLVNPIGVLTISGVLGYTIPTNIPKNIVQVGSFTVRGTLGITGNIGYTLGAPTPKNLVQVGATGINGVVKVIGAVGLRQPWQLATQPMAMTGVLKGTAVLGYPVAFSVVHLGRVTVNGTLLFENTSFQSIEHVTEGLPAGWYTAKYLETVPNPNYGTAYGNHFFTRWTWKGFDPAGTMVAASGSEQDCFSQTLSICQSRHETWRELAR